MIKPPVQVAAAPFAVVVAQLNDDTGDGRIDEADHLDVAVACFGSDPDPSDPGGVWILRNDGNGTLTVAERHAAGRAPSSLAAVDLDRDGELDLVVANYLSNDVSVFTNDGGTFTLKHVARGGFGPMDIVAVDIDRDGCVDLAVTGGGMTRVSILRNLGDGTLADAVEHFPDSSRADFPTSRPVSVVGGSLNREGLFDLAVANGKTGEIWIVSNVASGTGVGAAADGDPYATARHGTGRRGRVVPSGRGDSPCNSSVAANAVQSFGCEPRRRGRCGGRAPGGQLSKSVRGDFVTPFAFA